MMWLVVMLRLTTLLRGSGALGRVIECLPILLVRGQLSGETPKVRRTRVEVQHQGLAAHADR